MANTVAIVCGFVLLFAVSAAGESANVIDSCQGEACQAHLEETGAPTVDDWSLLQLQQHEAPEIPSPDAACATSGARWCSVKVPGAASFFMAVYDGNDIVSNEICNFGQWEDLGLKDLGPPGHALDVGGNLGYFTFVLAKAGWTVSTFEPIPKNAELIKATLCANPDLRSKVTLHNVGLGAEPDQCQIISDNNNIGDGISRCGSSVQEPVPDGYAVRGSFPVVRLDDELTHAGVDKVDFVKIDVEGFECQVFQGAPEFFVKYKPRMLHTEVWGNMHDCKPKDYLKMFSTNGYKITKDEQCKKADSEVPIGDDSTMTGGIKNFWMCQDAAGTDAGSALESEGTASASLLQLDSSLHFQKRRVHLRLA